MHVITIRWVLLLLALICFGAAAAGVQTPRVNLVGLGLSLWVLSLLIPSP
jgi:hypothetical protein